MRKNYSAFYRRAISCV